MHWRSIHWLIPGQIRPKVHNHHGRICIPTFTNPNVLRGGLVDVSGWIWVDGAIRGVFLDPMLGVRHRVGE